MKTIAKCPDKIFADFLGWKICPVRGSFDNGPLIRKYPRFATDWNHLMFVIMAIEQEAPNRVVIDCNECRIVSEKRFKVHTIKKINSVYRAAMEYIIWRNENKNP